VGRKSATSLRRALSDPGPARGAGRLPGPPGVAGGTAAAGSPVAPLPRCVRAAGDVGGGADADSPRLDETGERGGESAQVAAVVDRRLPGRPCGRVDWQRHVAKQLGLESPRRASGRPRKFAKRMLPVMAKPAFPLRTAGRGWRLPALGGTGGRPSRPSPAQGPGPDPQSPHLPAPFESLQGPGICLALLAVADRAGFSPFSGPLERDNPYKWPNRRHPLFR
jgi:hypothetical protein